MTAACACDPSELTQRKKFSHPYVPRINAGGNFCGHHPLKPILSMLPEHKVGKKGLPRVLTLMIERTQQFFKDPDKIPSLNEVNHSARQQRSERREACIRLLNVMLEFTDLVTLRVAVPNRDDSWTFLDHRFLAQRTGMNLKRVQRALSDMVYAGLITIKQRVENVSENPNKKIYRGLASIKCINKKLFQLFGLNKVLEKERKRASQQRRAKSAMSSQQSTKNEVNSAKFSLLMRGQQSRAERTHKPKGTKPLHTNRKQSTEYRRLLVLLIGDLQHQHPDWSVSDCQEMASEMLDRPNFYESYRQQHS